MFHGVMAAGFKDIDETHEIGIHVSMGVLDRIADAGLRRQIYHPLGSVSGKGFVQHLAIFKAGSDFGEARIRLQARQAGALQVDIVIIVEVVEADDFVAARQQALRQCRTDKPRAACNQNFHDASLGAVFISGRRRRRWGKHI